MNDLLGMSFLRALWNASRRMQKDDPGEGVDDALTALVDAADLLVAGVGGAILSIVGDAFYLDRKMLASASTEFDGMLSDLNTRKIESITLSQAVTRADLADLAALIAGTSDHLPAEGTVRLNESGLRPSDLQVRPLHELRRSYSFSLDTLREISREGSLQMDRVLEAVDDFIDGGAPDPSSSMLLATVQNHDEITYYHSVNVCLLSMALGRFVGFGRDDLRMLGLGGLLHDVGRVVIDEAAVGAPGRLSNEDWAQVRLHPQEGAATILAAGGNGHEIAAVVALEHHARIDGGGYPDLGGRQPHLFSRVVAIADSYEAITSFRPYRPARTPNEALRVLLEGAGTVFDADLLRLFIQMTGEYPPGSLLVIADGRVVMVTDSSDGARNGLVVRSAEGEVLSELEPIELTGIEFTSQLMADEAGVDPGSVLESMEHGGSAGR